jgi:hypothetical protein
MEATFPYACHLKGDLSCCICDDPIVPITLHFAGKKFRTDGLIDSGCSVTHANTEVAELMGLDLGICVETESIGIGGKNNAIKAYLTEIEFEIEGMGEPFRGPILFTENLPYSVLLGQDNFFDKFDVLFQKSSGSFTLKRVG